MGVVSPFLELPTSQEIKRTETSGGGPGIEARGRLAWGGWVRSGLALSKHKALILRCYMHMFVSIPRVSLRFKATLKK